MKIIFDVFEMEKEVFEEKIVEASFWSNICVKWVQFKKNCELFNILDIVFNFSDDDSLELVQKGQL